MKERHDMAQTKQFHRITTRSRLFILAAFSVILSITGLAQQHQSNWLHRNMMDTTVVRCWNDSLSTIHVPPGSMGMMLPDSMYCRMEMMPMDSLHHPHDSTHIGWCRVMMGDDSLHFNYMNCDSTHGSNHHQMGFLRGLRCEMRWDSTLCDSTRRHWRPTGVRGWDGTAWVTMSGVTFNRNTAVFTTTQLYSAYSFTGVPNNPTGVESQKTIPARFELQQNYPNPFNPSTTIGFNIPASSRVSVKIFNLLGQEVVSLVNGDLVAGTHAILWNGKDNAARSVASGLYFYKLTATANVGGQEFTQIRKMILMK